MPIPAGEASTCTCPAPCYTHSKSPILKTIEEILAIVKDLQETIKCLISEDESTVGDDEYPDSQSSDDELPDVVPPAIVKPKGW